MRFVIALIFMFAGSGHFAWGKPGDVYEAGHDFPKPDLNSVEGGRSGTLKTLQGYVLTLIERNLTSTAALTAHGNDLYILKSDGTLTKLRDRDGDGKFETRAAYLVGFENPIDMVVAKDTLFVSDQFGIWRIEIEPSLAATKTPTLFIAAHTQGQKGGRFDIHPAFLAFSPHNNILNFSSQTADHQTDIYTVDVKTDASGKRIRDGQRRRVASKTSYPFAITRLAAAPTGALFAIKHGIKAEVTALNGAQTTAPATAPSTEATKTHNINISYGSQNMALGGDIAFYPMELDADIYPASWRGTLIKAVADGLPMIGFSGFEYGELSAATTSIVEGFSERGARVGYQTIYAYPSELTVMDDGRIIFLDNKGALWAVDKAPPVKPEPKDVNAPAPKKPMVKPDPFRSFRQDILSGENKVQDKKIKKNAPIKDETNPAPKGQNKN